MDRQRYDELADRIAERFHERPDAIAGHTWKWLWLGHFVIIAMTIVLIGGGIAVFFAGTQNPGFGLLLVGLGVVLMIFGFGQVGTLFFFDQPEPKGRKLPAGEAPELHELVGMVCDTIGSPTPNEILLIDEFNASVVQQPRLGFFGWSKSWLILGVPLMLAMPKEELTAVIGHECAHLSRKHGRQGHRIARMNYSWDILFEKLRQKSGNMFFRWGSLLVMWFLNWYWPRFHARARLLSRQNELLADRLAVEATNQKDAACALWRIACLGYFLESQFWVSLRDEAGTRPSPPDDFCNRLKIAFEQAHDSPEASHGVRYAMEQVSLNEDTHPSMSERLTAIGISESEKQGFEFPRAPHNNSAEDLLPGWSEIESAIDKSWRDSITATWSDQHRRIVAIRELAEPDLSHDLDESDPVKLWQDIRSIVDARGIETAEPQLRRLLSIDDQHVGATMVMGQLRLTQGHYDGEHLLQWVVGLQTAEWTHPAGEILESHFAKTGRREELRRLRQSLDEFEKMRIASEKERTEIRRNDPFAAHELSESDLRKLISALTQHEPCEAAWLVQKRLKHFPEERMFVLCVDAANDGQRTARNDRMITSLILKLELPGRIFIVNPTGEFRSVARRLMKREHNKVFSR